MKMLKPTRRRFLRFLTAAPAGLWAFARGQTLVRAGSDGPRISPAFSPHPPDPRIVIAKRPDVGEKNGLVPVAGVARVLSDSITAATGKADPSSAWRSLFKPDDIVSIKVNCLAGRGLSSHPELVGAIVDGLASAGVSRDRVVIWDRSLRELVAAGFPRTGINGARVLATDLPQVGYERDIEFSGEVGSCFSRLLTRSCTAIINVPVLKDHDLSGVSIGMKNFYGAIHNPNKYHENLCDPFQADLYSLDVIGGKEKTGWQAQVVEPILLLFN